MILGKEPGTPDIYAEARDSSVLLSALSEELKHESPFSRGTCTGSGPRMARARCSRSIAAPFAPSPDDHCYCQHDCSDQERHEDSYLEPKHSLRWPIC